MVSPVRKAPTIKDLIADPKVEEDTSSSENADVETEKEIAQLADTQDAETSELPSENRVSEDSDSTASTDEKFEEKWTEMFELLFREIPTIYYPLKDIIPPISDNVITVSVNNELMKENFESRTRLALEYLRNHYSPQVDDIKVVVREDTQPKKKLIYDTQDKMDDLKNQNPDLPEFLEILKLSAKDF